MRQAFAGVLLVVLGTGCATRSATYLAKVNDETITGADLRAEFARSHQALDKILGDEKDVRKFLDRLVDRRLFVQEGYRMGLQDRPDVREDLARFRAQKMVEAFVKDELDEKSKPSDDEVKAIHAGLTHRTEVRQIVVRTQPEAEAIAAAVRSGADLEALAREKSIAPSAKRGGFALVGWGADEAYEAVLPALTEGQVSAPFQSRLGWELLRLEKRTPLEKPPVYEKVAPQIRRILQARKRAVLDKALHAGLWAKYDVKTVDCAPTLDVLRKAAGTAAGEATCATWTGGKMTVADLAGRLKLDHVDKLEREWPELRTTFRDELVSRDVAALEAEARGYAARPEIADGVKRRQDELVEGKLFSEYVAKAVTANDDDALRYYEGHEEQFVEDARYDLAHVVVDTKEEAAAVEEKVKSRQPFAEIAAAHSKDKDTADKGGKIGEVEKKQLKGALAPITSLEEGGVSGALEVSGRFHVVKVLGITPPRQRPFDEVKDQARERALQERKVAELDRWIKTLRDAGRIQISGRGIRAYEKERIAWIKEEDEKKRVKEEAEAAAKAEAQAAEAEAARQEASPAAAPAVAPAAAPSPASSPHAAPPHPPPSTSTQPTTR